MVQQWNFLLGNQAVSCRSNLQITFRCNAPLANCEVGNVQLSSAPPRNPYPAKTNAHATSTYSLLVFNRFITLRTEGLFLWPMSRVFLLGRLSSTRKLGSPEYCQLKLPKKRLFMHHPRRHLGQGFETLEQRDLLTSVPFGATSQDTAEFLLGDVTVNVVFMESNGEIDPSTEDWNAALTAEVKANIEEGVNWWSDTLANYTNIHELNFNFDYQYADQPVATSYEPISRRSQDFVLWTEEFFRAAGIPSSAGFTQEIREFNHQQRIAHNTNWSFTIFVVNAENDPNDRFGNASATDTEFKRAFAYTGGQFIVMPHNRPASTVAHELAHIFWAHDEYSGSDSYTDRRGYYATQNTNAADGHPDPTSRETSILISTSSAYPIHAISQCGRETIGWRDSDGDGIFDVLDVEHTLQGSIDFDPTTRRIRFIGSSSVQTLPNRNPAGTQNSMTINRLTALQYRFDDGDWQNLLELDSYQADINATTPPAPPGTAKVSFRTIDDRTTVTSMVVTEVIDVESPFLQNPANRFDVNGDTHVAPNDVLTLIQAINRETIDLTRSGPPFLDVSGDGFVSPRDVLELVIHINEQVSQPNGVSARALVLTEVDADQTPQLAVTEAIFASLSSISALDEDEPFESFG